MAVLRRSLLINNDQLRHLIPPILLATFGTLAFIVAVGEKRRVHVNREKNVDAPSDIESTPRRRAPGSSTVVIPSRLSLLLLLRYATGLIGICFVFLFVTFCSVEQIAHLTEVPPQVARFGCHTSHYCWDHSSRSRR